MRIPTRISLIACIASFLFTSSVCQVFSPPYNVAPNLGLSAGSPRVAFGASGAAYLIWQDQNMPLGKSDFDIFFARSNNELTKLSAPRPLGSLSGNAYNNVIAANGSAVYVAWEEFDPDLDRYDVFFTASRDAGATFDSPISVNPAMASSMTPQLATAPDGSVYIIWADGRTGDIYLRASRDEGLTLGPLVNVSNDSEYSSEPKVAVDAAGMLHIAWTTQLSDVPVVHGILYANSLDGSTFSSPQNLSVALGDSYSPRIAISGIFVYVAWKADKLWLSRSSDHGVSFGSPQDISLSVQYPSLVQLVAAAKNVYVMFSGYEPYYDKAFIARSNNQGGNFTLPLRLSNAWSEGPHLSARGYRADMVWSDRTTGNFEVRYTHTADGGRHWSRVQNVSKSSPDSTDAWIAIAPDGDVAVTWEENGEDVWASVGRFVSLSNHN